MELDTEPSELREYLAVLRLRKASIIGITLLTILLTLFFSFRQTPIYESETQVLVTPVPTSNTTSPTTTLLNLDTERTIATSLEVAELASERLEGADDPAALLENLEVAVETNTEVLTFTYSDPHPLEAQRRAEAFADAYLEFRREKALDSLLALSESFEERSQELERELSSLNRQIAATPDESERANLQAQASSLVAQIAVLEEKSSELAPADRFGVGEIIAPAALPSSAASPNHVLNGVLALLVGLALGVGVAFLRERLDDRLRGQADLEARAGAPVLAVVPRIPTWRKHAETPLVTLADPKSGATEAYKTLRTSLLFAAAERGFRSILVASPHPGEGKTATAANIAVALAQSGRRVIVVSADLRKPRLHRFFSLSNEAGLSSVLTGEASLADVIVDPGIQNLRLIPSGPIPKNPAELLGSHGMQQVMAQLRDLCDIVVVDSPPVLNVADTMGLASTVDAVVLLADADSTPARAIAHARRQLDHVRAEVVGAVLNNLDPTKGRAYYYAYYPYYRYRYRYYEVEEGPRGRQRRTRERSDDVPAPAQPRPAAAAPPAPAPPRPATAGPRAPEPPRRPHDAGSVADRQDHAPAPAEGDGSDDPFFDVIGWLEDHDEEKADRGPVRPTDDPRDLEPGPESSTRPPPTRDG